MKIKGWVLYMLIWIVVFYEMYGLELLEMIELLGCEMIKKYFDVMIVEFVK